MLCVYVVREREKEKEREKEREEKGKTKYILKVELRTVFFWFSSAGVLSILYLVFFLGGEGGRGWTNLEIEI